MAAPCPSAWAAGAAALRPGSATWVIVSTCPFGAPATRTPSSTTLPPSPDPRPASVRAGMPARDPPAARPHRRRTDADPLPLGRPRRFLAVDTAQPRLYAPRGPL